MLILRFSFFKQSATLLLDMSIEYISNNSFLLFFSVLMLCASYAFSLFTSLILNSRKTALLATALAVAYFALDLNTSLSSANPQIQTVYLTYIIVLAAAIVIGLFLGIRTRKFVSDYAKVLEKKQSKNRTAVLLIIFITLLALLYDIYYLSTPPKKSAYTGQNISIQLLK